jgi:hypothetical protein
LHDAAFYKEDELIQYNDQVISLDHHSRFNTGYIHQTLEK